MTRIRDPAVAGSFYPSNPDELRTAVETLLDQAATRASPAPRALVVPHAGYIYSGAVAATAYAQLRPHRETYRRVVLLGPAHRVALQGLALPGAETFSSPIGQVRLDLSAIEELDHFSVSVDADAHRLEHSLEVQLPFLQAVLGRFRLVPLVVGVAETESVAEVIDCLWDAPSTLVVVSSDLSHYLAYEAARERDLETCQAIEALNPGRIAHSGACGAVCLKGLLAVAARRGLVARTLELCNSGDTAGNRERVVGYGAWMFVEEEPCKTAS